MTNNAKKLYPPVSRWIQGRARRARRQPPPTQRRLPPAQWRRRGRVPRRQVRRRLPPQQRGRRGGGRISRLRSQSTSLLPQPQSQSGISQARQPQVSRPAGRRGYSRRSSLGPLASLSLLAVFSMRGHWQNVTKLKISSCALLARSRSPGYDREYRSSRDEYRPSSRGGRDSYDDRDRGMERGERAERGDRGVERGYGRSEY